MSSQKTKYSPLLLQILSLKFLLVEETAPYLKEKKQKSSVKYSACNIPHSPYSWPGETYLH